MSVRTQPGLTQNTVICGASAAASWRVAMFSAALLIA